MINVYPKDDSMINPDYDGSDPASAFYHKSPPFRARLGETPRRIPHLISQSSLSIGNVDGIVTDNVPGATEGVDVTDGGFDCAGDDRAFPRNILGDIGGSPLLLSLGKASIVHEVGHGRTESTGENH